MGYVASSLSELQIVQLYRFQYKGVLVDGIWCDSPNDIKDATANHYAERFKEKLTVRPKFLSPLFRKLSAADSLYLDSNFSMEEVKDAVWSCANSKAPGPDVILDRCLNANEIIRMAKIEDHKLLLFKVDFEKSFDSVSSISIPVNGSPSKEFKMERGLWQGDPLSPFLFLLVVEALQISIIKACNKGIYKGVSLAESGDNLSLLQYADDDLFFRKWSRSNVNNLIHILRCFELALGLKVNLAKIRIFGVGVEIQEVEAVASSIDRLSAWKAKALSIGGCLTLIQSVLGSIPLYYLSLFKAPLKVFMAMMGVSPLLKLLKVIKARGVRLLKPFQGSKILMHLLNHILNHIKAVSGKTSGSLEIGERVLSRKSGFGETLLVSVLGESLIFYLDLGGVYLDGILGMIYGSGYGTILINTCIWRASIDRLPTRTNLISRGVNITSTRCPFCDNMDEYIGHYLNNCPRVIPIWRKVWSWWQLDTPVSFPSFSISDISFGNFANLGCPKLNKVVYGVFQCGLWMIWKWRNKIVHASPDSRNKVLEEDIFPSIQRLSKTWIAARCKSSPCNWNNWISNPRALFSML
ncbi:reverse transcriptase domain, reverse transcriptase zinc-binding domain protein [Tanacetum coccineum]